MSVLTSAAIDERAHRAAGSILRTRHLRGRVKRSRQGCVSAFLSFPAIASLPLVRATAVNVLTPLIVIAAACVVVIEPIGAAFRRWAPA